MADFGAQGVSGGVEMENGSSGPGEGFSGPLIPGPHGCRPGVSCGVAGLEMVAASEYQAEWSRMLTARIRAEGRRR